MKTTIYLIRHGETDWNLEKRVQGSTDISMLTDKGKKEARSLKKELSGIRFYAVYSSPLKRSLETAEIVVPGKDIKVKKGLTERHLGKFEGLFFSEIKERYPEIQKVKEQIGTTPWFEGSEKLEDLGERGVKSLEEISNNNIGKKIAVFSHGGIIEATIAAIQKIPQMHKDRFEHNNCGYSIIEYEDGKFSVKVLNHNAHLKWK